MRAIIYTKSGCPYCNLSKSLFLKYNIEYEEFDVAQYSAEFNDALAQVTHPTYTKPQIWLDGKYVGGFSQLKAYLEG